MNAGVRNEFDLTYKLVGKCLDYNYGVFSEGSSETSGKGTASSVTSRLYNGQTASSR